jgi:Pre-mRNA splicing factor PRP21 like protein
VDAAKLAFRSIDWHDFSVVETIEFPANELTDVTFGAADEDMDIDMVYMIHTYTVFNFHTTLLLFTLLLWFHFALR